MKTLLSTACAAALIFGLSGGIALAQGDPLAAAFATPPDSAKPRVWWHWMNGNITKEGIDADFAWMKRVGIAGVQNFDANLGNAHVIENRLAFLTPAWRDAFKYAVTEADRLGLEFAIAGSPGWSVTGGPWVKPEWAMKKLVWSETEIAGGRRFSGLLAPPPSNAGAFQDVPLANEHDLGGAAPAVPAFYRDALVIAYRLPRVEAAGVPAPRMSASAPMDFALLSDGKLAHPAQLPFTPGADAWIVADYGRPVTIRAVTLGVPAEGNPYAGQSVSQAEIQVSDHGKTWRTVAKPPVGGPPQHTIALTDVSARYYRVLLHPRTAQGAFAGPPPPAPTSHPVVELRFEVGARVHRFEDKAGWSSGLGMEHAPTAAAGAGAVIPKGDVVDLTGRMRPDGSLDWTPPAGRWKILRLGYSLLGVVNHPASAEGTGLEVDKLNRDYVKAYADAYLGEYEKAVGPEMIGKRGLRYMIVDSYEAGPQNWTDDMVAEFKSRRGYDPTPWAPVLTGRIVESSDASERFLYDFRRTLGELMADEHYGQLTQSLHARGMGRYGESHETGRVMLADGMQAKKSADIPMGATWTSTREQRGTTPDADIRESASVAHIYGQNLVAAESFTAMGDTYGFTPERLKPTADRMMSNGLNRFIVHTSVHQPTDAAGPGVGLGPFGQWFTRKETWAEQAGPWMTYLARSSQLLQQGRFAADVVWFYGEDSNITALYGASLPAVPDGYAYDFVNADALVNLLGVTDGRVTTPSGMSYRVLALGPETRRMSLPTLKKIEALVKEGAVVVGAKPQTTPGLADDGAEFRAITDRLWGGGQVGAGRVFPSLDVGAALAALDVGPDVAYPKDAQLAYVHRTLPDGEVYFISSRSDKAQTVDLSFRVAGKAPQLWRADTGTITPLSYSTENGRTVTPLRLAAHDAVFVVFRDAATASSRTVPDAVTTTVATLDGDWDVSFPGGLGAPPKARLPLGSWTGSADPGIKYFSGEATYSRTLNVPAAWRKDGGRVVLDLGSVKNLAQVSVNGKPAGHAWKAPFQVDITDAVRTGANRLEIKVANLWVNRLIGDKQPGAAKIASATFDPIQKDQALLPSGLIGPVQVVLVSRPR